MSAFRALAPPVQIGRDGKKRFLSRGARSNTNRKRWGAQARKTNARDRQITDTINYKEAIDGANETARNRDAENRERVVTAADSRMRTGRVLAFIATVVFVLIIAVFIVLLF